MPGPEIGGLPAVALGWVTPCLARTVWVHEAVIIPIPHPISGEVPGHQRRSRAGMRRLGRLSIASRSLFRTSCAGPAGPWPSGHSRGFAFAMRWSGAGFGGVDPGFRGFAG